MRWWGDGVVCSRFVHVLVSNHWGVLIMIISGVYGCFVTMAWWNSLCGLLGGEVCKLFFMVAFGGSLLDGR